MTKLTIVTALARSMADHFQETADSVASSREMVRHAGYECSWVVCVDGAGDAPIHGLEIADAVTHLGAQFGVSTARNAAAAKAPSDAWLFPLDGDDVLLPEGITRLAELLGGLPDEVAWVSSNRVELDGSRGPWHTAEMRTYRAGELNAEYQHPHYFHPNNVAYRSSAVFSVGGWPAMPGGEDLALTLRVAHRFSGVAITDSTVAYRRWAKQTMNNDYARLRPVRHGLFERFEVLGDRDISELRRPGNESD